MDNSYTLWATGYFVDGEMYRNWTVGEKRKAQEREMLLVRPSPKGNAICKCAFPEEAKWIASRLNLAAKLEQKNKLILNNDEEYLLLLNALNFYANHCLDVWSAMLQKGFKKKDGTAFSKEECNDAKIRSDLCFELQARLQEEK